MSGQFVPKYLFPSKHPALFWWRCINQNNAKKEGPERPASEGSGPGPEHPRPEVSGPERP